MKFEFDEKAFMESMKTTMRAKVEEHGQAVFDQVSATHSGAAPAVVEGALRTAFEKAGLSASPEGVRKYAAAIAAGQRIRVVVDPSDFK